MRLFLILIFLGLIVFIFLLGRFIVFYSEKWISVLIDWKHRSAESVLNSGFVPPDWKKNIFMMLGIDALAKYTALRKLKIIIRYFKRSPLVEDEETRETIVSRLTEVREQWKRMKWENICPSKMDH